MCVCVCVCVCVMDRKYESLLSLSPHCVFSYDFDGSVLDWWKNSQAFPFDS